MTYGSSRDAARSVPGAVPRHVAIIMDGNGRWARARFLPRAAGHRAGVGALRTTVEECQNRGCEVLTVFAFSSENWRRPATEVGLLMQLLVESLEREIDALARNGIRMRFIGDRSALPEHLGARMTAAEARTAGNRGLTMVIAIAYGGRWDVVNATRKLAARAKAGTLDPAAIDEEAVARELELATLPDPDLFIRTGGETRISNFLLWNLAYTELWFTDVLWPDFGAREIGLAFEQYAGRTRRFGTVEEDGSAGRC